MHISSQLNDITPSSLKSAMEEIVIPQKLAFAISQGFFFFSENTTKAKKTWSWSLSYLSVTWYKGISEFSSLLVFVQPRIRL